MGCIRPATTKLKLQGDTNVPVMFDRVIEGKQRSIMSSFCELVATAAAAD